MQMDIIWNICRDRVRLTKVMDKYSAGLLVVIVTGKLLHFDLCLVLASVNKISLLHGISPGISSGAAAPLLNCAYHRSSGPDASVQQPMDLAD